MNNYGLNLWCLKIILKTYCNIRNYIKKSYYAPRYGGILMINKTRLLLPVAFLILMPALSFAQIVLPPVTSPVIKKVSVIIPELKNVGAPNSRAAEFVEVLRNDMRNAALFDVRADNINVTDEGTVDLQSLFEKEIDFAISGQYRSSGDTMTIALRAFDVNQEKALLGKTYTVSPGKVREAAHRFANEVMKDLTGIDGFFTSKLVVVQGTKKRNLYIMDYDGYNSSRLTNHNSLLLSPDCSSDGSKVVFNSDKVWDQDLYVIDLIPRPRETRLARPFIMEQSPAWSPDGSRIAYSSDGDIYISNADGKGVKRITSHRGIDVSPTWSPDGTQIAFVSDRTGKPQIYVMSTTGGNVRQLTFGDYSTDPAWSPNPSVNRVAFVRVEDGHANIYTVKPDGSAETRLTSGTGRNENPSWTPDGHYIAFSSTRDASRNIYIMYLNGENQRRLTSGGNKSFPTWCRR